MNLFDLYAKITLDDSEYNKKLGDASTKTEGFASKLGGGLKKAAAVGAKAVAAGAAVAASGVVAMTKQAIENYAEYEQLVGGVETLFKDSADAVMGYAAKAYQTAGLSANEYMSTVTSFSASLLQSLGGDTAAAADYADQAIVDMADNANKMGTSMESIQNAYQGFAKQNYTMLDNLKLGYGGTKEEMERLIADANAVKVANGEMADLSIDSFADITEAIHIVQTEMGITGTTAKEASSTISGSVASMKGAWTNLVTGLGDANADIDKLLDDFLSSVETVGKNLLPAIGRIVGSIFSTLEERGPDMIAEGVLLLGKLAVGLIKAIPQLVAKIPEIVKKIVQAFKDRGPEFKGVGKNIVEGIWSGISALGSWFKEKISDFFGGIVGGVKKLLGIQSPSKVFAGIGGYMAEGLGKGWDDEYSGIRQHIESGMEFDTARVGFESSAMSRGNSVMFDKMQNAFQGIGEGATFVLDVMLDGATVARKTYKYNKREDSLRGGSLVEVGV